MEFKDHERNKTKSVEFVGRDYNNKMMAQFFKFFEVNLFQCQISDTLP